MTLTTHLASILRVLMIRVRYARVAPINSLLGLTVTVAVTVYGGPARLPSRFRFYLADRRVGDSRRGAAIRIFVDELETGVFTYTRPAMPARR